MDALGFVLIVAGAMLLAEQLLSLYAGQILATAMAGKFDKFTVNYALGRVGILLTVAGFLVSRFV